MNTQIEIFWGSFISSAGGIFKSAQMVNIPTLDEVKNNVNEFINREDIEIISISHQLSDGLIAVLVQYKKKG